MYQLDGIMFDDLDEVIGVAIESFNYTYTGERFVVYKDKEPYGVALKNGSGEVKFYFLNEDGIEDEE